jgi:predicted outer membrane lipoprotein
MNIPHRVEQRSFVPGYFRKREKKTMQYRINILGVTLATCLASINAWATEATDEVTQMKREILNLKHKIERLEKSRKTEKTPEAEGDHWFERIEMSGLVEVEASYVDGPDGSESDLAVATVELGLEAQVTPWVNAHVLFLHEEDADDPIEIDEAIVTIANPDASPFSIAAGRMYVPFGNFDSALVSDPLTLEIGETRETAVQLGWLANGFHALAYGFNGDANDGGSAQIDGYGLSLGYSREAEGDGLSFNAGLSWISKLADSNSLQETVTDPDSLANAVTGWSTHATLHWHTFTLIGEYLSATDNFDAADLDFNGADARPSAWNLEVDYGFGIAGREAEVAVAWQGTDEALALELPEQRWLAALSVGIYDQTSLSIEYAHDQDYGVHDGGSGEDSDTVTLQLAVEF